MTRGGGNKTQQHIKYSIRICHKKGFKGVFKRHYYCSLSDLHENSLVLELLEPIVWELYSETAVHQWRQAPVISIPVKGKSTSTTWVSTDAVQSQKQTKGLKTSFIAFARALDPSNHFIFLNQCKNTGINKQWRLRDVQQRSQVESHFTCISIALMLSVLEDLNAALQGNKSGGLKKRLLSIYYWYLLYKDPTANFKFVVFQVKYH